MSLIAAWISNLGDYPYVLIQVGQKGFLWYISQQWQRFKSLTVITCQVVGRNYDEITDTHCISWFDSAADPSSS